MLSEQHRRKATYKTFIPYVPAAVAAAAAFAATAAATAAAPVVAVGEAERLLPPQGRLAGRPRVVASWPSAAAIRPYRLFEESHLDRRASEKRK